MNDKEKKVIADLILSTWDTVLLLNKWLGLLETWQEQDVVEADDFSAICRELREAGLWGWAADVGGHGIAALAGMTNVDLPAASRRRYS